MRDVARRFGALMIRIGLAMVRQGA
jgi:hypothetical protein